MFTAHLDKFNDSINMHGRTPDTFAEHDSILYHEGKMYDLIGEYIQEIDTLASIQMDWYLRHIRHHVNAILAYLELDIDADCVMYEAIDVQGARLIA